MSDKKMTQKEYLKKYLSSKDKKKKKKKRPKAIGDSLKVIDDDVDLSKLKSLDEAELILFETNEDAPQIAGIIDERPVELRETVSRTNVNWRSLDDSGSQSDKDDTLKNIDSDASPPRITKNMSKKDPNRNIKQHHNNRSDSDCSPPRARKNRSSSPRQNSKKSQRAISPQKKIKNYYDSDASPPRKSRTSTHQPSAKIKKPYQSLGSDSDCSGPRSKSIKYSGATNVNKRNTDIISQMRNDGGSNTRVKSPKPYISIGSDSDCSPPRSSTKTCGNGRRDENKSRRKSRWNDDDSPRHRTDDISIQAGENNSTLEYESKKRKTEKIIKGQNDSNQDSDISPPRKCNSVSRNHDSQRGEKAKSKHDSTRPERMAKTLDGKTAGLQNAKDMRIETESFRKRENEMFKAMNEEISGRHAKTIVRDRKTGRQRDLQEEQKEEKEKQERNRERNEKYSKWGKGLKQVEDYNARLQNDKHEMSKPLARYANDDDLENHLRSKVYADDPMLEYMQRKRMENQVKSGMQVKPQYQGSYPPNRYDIRPGYRWDGVDRSTGYEKSWFENINSKKALEDEAYKWSTEDM